MEVGQMLLILALILALIFLPWPWNLAVIAAAACFEVLLAVFGVRYTRRPRVRVGIETLVGATAEAITALDPDGQVKVNGEIWEAHSDPGVQAGASVRITGVRGLTLHVEPAG
jgi:membrane-bound serine protease (ClpP class)